MTTIQPAFIDFEASSLDLIASYPIEVGICMPDGTLHSWLISPHVLWQDWSQSAEQIHGISRETLEADGIAVSEVASALNELLPEQVFCDAWTFDSFWLHRLFRAADMQPAFQLESISLLLNPSQVRHWTPARQKVIAELPRNFDKQNLFMAWTIAGGVPTAECGRAAAYMSSVVPFSLMSVSARMRGLGDSVFLVPRMPISPRPKKNQKKNM